MFACDWKFPMRMLRAFTKIYPSVSFRNYKVVLTGATSQTGQNLALLLKSNAMVSELALYDPKPMTDGVAMDVGHLDSPAAVSSAKDPKNLKVVMSDATVVVVASGRPTAPEMTPNDVFEVNAPAVYEAVSAMARWSPSAMLVMATEPINSMVPLAGIILTKNHVFNPCRLFGITSFNNDRATKVVSDLRAVEASTVSVPVVGGRSGSTMVPVFSQASPSFIIDSEEAEKVTVKVRSVDEELVNSRKSDGPDFGMAHATARFVASALKGLSGEHGIVENAFVRSSITLSPYFATPILLGRTGMEANFGYGFLSDYETNLLNTAVTNLLKDAVRGTEYKLLA